MGQKRSPAVTSQAHNPALRAVPTVIESGTEGFQMAGFYGFLAPGADPAFMDSNEFAQFLASEPLPWAPALEASGSMLD